MHHTAVNTFKVIGRGMRKPTDTITLQLCTLIWEYVRVQSVVLPYMEGTMWLPPPQQKKTLAITLKMAMGIYI